MRIKSIILTILAGCMITGLVGAFSQTGGFGQGQEEGAIVVYDGTGVVFADTSWTLGHTDSRIAKGWFTAADIGTLDVATTTISAVVAGNMNMANNLITNIGNASTDFTTGGGLNLAGVLDVTGTTTLATTTIAYIDITGGVATFSDVTTTNFSCTNCLNATEIEDIYLLVAGDTVDGNLTVSGTSTLATTTIVGDFLLSGDAVKGIFMTGNYESAIKVEGGEWRRGLMIKETLDSRPSGAGDDSLWGVQATLTHEIDANAHFIGVSSQLTKHIGDAFQVVPFEGSASVTSTVNRVAGLVLSTNVTTQPDCAHPDCFPHTTDFAYLGAYIYQHENNTIAGEAGLGIQGYWDYGLHLGYSSTTADILFQNDETLSNLTDGTIAFDGDEATTTISVGSASTIACLKLRTVDDTGWTYFVSATPGAALTTTTAAACGD